MPHHYKIIYNERFNRGEFEQMGYLPSNLSTLEVA